MIFSALAHGVPTQFYLIGFISPHVNLRPGNTHIYTNLILVRSSYQGNIEIFWDFDVSRDVLENKLILAFFFWTLPKSYHSFSHYDHYFLTVFLISTIILTTLSVDQDSKKNVHTITWREICKPTKFGGLGLEIQIVTIEPSWLWHAGNISLILTCYVLRF